MCSLSPPVGGDDSYPTPTQSDDNGRCGLELALKVW